MNSMLTALATKFDAMPYFIVVMKSPSWKASVVGYGC